LICAVVSKKDTQDPEWLPVLFGLLIAFAALPYWLRYPIVAKADAYGIIGSPMGFPIFKKFVPGTISPPVKPCLDATGFGEELLVYQFSRMPKTAS
jgi:hypothetical protein